jgi:hypothetical protein
VKIKHQEYAREGSVATPKLLVPFGYKRNIKKIKNSPTTNIGENTDEGIYSE